MALGDYMGAQCHACIGGTSVREDMRKLDAGQHIVVGKSCYFFIFIFINYSDTHQLVSATPSLFPCELFELWCKIKFKY